MSANLCATLPIVCSAEMRQLAILALTATRSHRATLNAVSDAESATAQPAPI